MVLIWYVFTWKEWVKEGRDIWMVLLLQRKYVPSIIRQNEAPEWLFWRYANCGCPQQIQFLFWDVIFNISSLLDPDIPHEVALLQDSGDDLLRLRFTGVGAEIFLAAAPSLWPPVCPGEEGHQQSLPSCYPERGIVVILPSQLSALCVWVSDQCRVRK